MADLAVLDAAFLNSIPRFTVPILLAAVGGLICQRAGVFNIALEGMLLVGAFAGVACSYAAESAAVGLLGAAAGGAAVGAVAAVAMIRYRADMIVAGIAINLLVSGLTVYLLRAIFDVKGTFQSARIASLRRFDLAGIERVPVLGDLVSRQTVLVYLALVLLAVVHVWLRRSRSGLRLRGVGEDPEAARAMGVSVNGYQSGALIVSGVLAGLGGAQLSLGNVTLFVEEMSAGRGWIAVVAVILARASTLGTAAASLLFGALDSLSLRVQALDIPSHFTEMIPYVATLVTLALVGARRGWARHRQRPDGAPAL